MGFVNINIKLNELHFYYINLIFFSADGGIKFFFIFPMSRW
jgi:hypothetical protein